MPITADAPRRWRQRSSTFAGGEHTSRRGSELARVICGPVEIAMRDEWRGEQALPLAMRVRGHHVGAAQEAGLRETHAKALGCFLAVVVE